MMIDPVDKRLTEFKWLVHKERGVIVLVAEPDAGKTGTSYTGAILTGRKPFTSSSENEKRELPSGG